MCLTDSVSRACVLAHTLAQVPIQLRVLKLLKHWVDNYFDEYFVDDKLLLAKINVQLVAAARRATDRSVSLLCFAQKFFDERATQVCCHSLLF